MVFLSSRDLFIYCCCFFTFYIVYVCSLMARVHSNSLAPNRWVFLCPHTFSKYLSRSFSIPIRAKNNQKKKKIGPFMCSGLSSYSFFILYIYKKSSSLCGLLALFCVSSVLCVRCTAHTSTQRSAYYEALRFLSNIFSLFLDFFSSAFFPFKSTTCYNI